MRMAVHLHDRGVEFLEAFRALSGDPLSQWPHAAYFLLNHSLEIILKSYLVVSDLGVAELKLFGHNLRKIFIACQSRGLPPVEDLDNLVRHLAHMNSDHDFRYPTFYKLTLPSTPECLVVMDSLVEALKPSMVEPRLRAWLHAAGAPEA